MFWYGLGRRVIPSETGNWSVFVLFGWRFVFGIIRNETDESPRISDAITALVGLIKLFLYYV